jgi:hypothetical protein
MLRKQKRRRIEEEGWGIHISIVETYMVRKRKLMNRRTGEDCKRNMRQVNSDKYPGLHDVENSRRIIPVAGM